MKMNNEDTDDKVLLMEARARVWGPLVSIGLGGSIAISIPFVGAIAQVQDVSIDIRPTEQLATLLVSGGLGALGIGSGGIKRDKNGSNSSKPDIDPSQLIEIASKLKQLETTVQSAQRPNELPKDF